MDMLEELHSNSAMNAAIVQMSKNALGVLQLQVLGLLFLQYRYGGKSHVQLKAFECPTSSRSLYCDKPYTMYSVLQSSNSSLELDTWLILIHQLAQAISYLHNQGFIHRDIKVDNVLVSHLNHECCAILIDFGKCTASTARGCLIKCLTPEEQEKYKRKHGHIAPEIINGSHPPSFASDVYCYGQIVCAVGAKVACDFLCALGKKCIYSDAKLRPKLIQIRKQLQSKIQWQCKRLIFYS